MRVPSVAEIRRKLARSPQHPPPVSQLRQPYEQVFARDKPGGYPSLDSSGVLATTTTPLHATNHKHGGTDEVAQHTPASNAIPKAGSTTRLDQAWVIKPTIVPGQNSLLGYDVPSGELTLRETGVDAVTLIDDTDSPYTVLNTDGIIICDPTTGAITINLPPVADVLGRRFIIVALNALHAITVLPDGAESIDRVSSVSFSLGWESIEIVASSLAGYEWTVVSSRREPIQAFELSDPTGVTTADFYLRAHAAGPATVLNWEALPTALPPSGAAGGVLSGTYPNPGFAADMATQAELDAEAAARIAADSSEASARAAADTAEASARAAADSSEASTRAAADTAEAAARIAADALKADLASPTLTGDPKAPTPATSDNDTSIATTAMVQAAIDADVAVEAAARVAADALKANIASPTFTGNPAAPTPATSDNDTSIATTAMVQAAIDADVAVEAAARSAEIAAHEADTTAVHGIANTAAITEANIAANTLTAASIAANAITSSELADNAVDTGAIADDAVTAAKIATDAVGTTEIAALAVTGSEIALNAVVRDHLGDNAVGTNELDETDSYTVSWLTLANLINTGLVENRIHWTGPGGYQVDDADLIFDGYGIIIGGEVVSGQIGSRATRIVARSIAGANTLFDVESISAGSGPAFNTFRARDAGSGVRRRVQSADVIYANFAFGAAAADDSSTGVYPSSGSGRTRFLTTESHTTTAKGTEYSIGTTPTGSATIADTFFVRQDGLAQVEMLAAKLTTPRSLTITADCGVYIPDHLTIAAGHTVEIGAGAVLEIG